MQEAFLQLILKASQKTGVQKKTWRCHGAGLFGSISTGGKSLALFRGVVGPTLFAGTLEKMFWDGF